MASVQGRLQEGSTTAPGLGGPSGDPTRDERVERKEGGWCTVNENKQGCRVSRHL